MKSKAPLALMEQLIMLLVFALSAALCLQVFALSHMLSSSGAAQDQAVAAVQSAAEALKAGGGSFSDLVRLHGGELTQDGWQIGYSDDWQAVPIDQAAFTVTASPAQDDLDLMGSASIAAHTAKGDPLFHITVYWQEDSDG